MKNSLRRILSPVVIAILSIYGLYSCSKDTSKSSTKPGPNALTLSASVVQKGEPLVVTAPAGSSLSSLRWVVSPATFAHITSGNGQAVVLFSRQGTYQVSAIYLDSTGNTGAGDSITASSPVTVTDSVYTPPSAGLDTVSLAGDQITLTPSSDSVSDLLMLAQTGKAYNCFPSLLYSIAQGAGGTTGIVINIEQVVEGSSAYNCNGATNPASSYLFLTPFVSSLANGTYPFTVRLNNTNYTGSLTISDAAYTFSWNYSSGVVISPLQIQKH